VNCIIANEENEKVTNVVLEEPEDNTPRNIFGEPIEEKPAPKPQKNTSGDKPKTETTKPKPTWKPFADAKGWMDDLFKSMNNDNV
jgi:hypothetical protein